MRRARARKRVEEALMQGKVIVVTGAFGVLGRAVTQRARAMGARAALIDHAPAPAVFAADPLALGGVDLTKTDAATQALQQIRTAAGRIDALLNIAGGFTWRTLEDGDCAAWDMMHAINLKTAVNASKAALPHLIETGGAIVNVGAAGAVKAAAGFGPYAASKSGVHKLTESLAQELKGRVRVNAVLPSILDTAQNRKDMPGADPKTWVQPDDLAKVMLFLASDDARAITGALLPVTGQV
jgi:NAD(P)-dependent dehydrogenase (short-subunit alcohol dehydrogenase family)